MDASRKELSAEMHQSIDLLASQTYWRPHPNLRTWFLLGLRGKGVPFCLHLGCIKVAINIIHLNLWKLPFLWVKMVKYCHNYHYYIE